MHIAAGLLAAEYYILVDPREVTCIHQMPDSLVVPWTILPCQIITAAVELILKAGTSVATELVEGRPPSPEANQEAQNIVPTT